MVTYSFKRSRWIRHKCRVCFVELEPGRTLCRKHRQIATTISKKQEP